MATFFDPDSKRGKGQRGAAFQAGAKGATVGTSIGRALAAPTGGLSVPVGAAIGAGVGLLAGGITGAVQAGKEYDEMEKLRKEQAKLAFQTKQEGIASERQMSAEDAKSRRGFAPDADDTAIMASIGGGSTYDNFMANTYG